MLFLVREAESRTNALDHNGAVPHAEIIWFSEAQEQTFLNSRSKHKLDMYETTTLIVLSFSSGLVL